MHAVHRVLLLWQHLAASTFTPLVSVLLNLHSSERPLPVLARLSWSAMDMPQPGLTWSRMRIGAC